MRGARVEPGWGRTVRPASCHTNSAPHPPQIAQPQESFAKLPVGAASSVPVTSLLYHRTVSPRSLVSPPLYQSRSLTQPPRLRRVEVCARRGGFYSEQPWRPRCVAKFTSREGCIDPHADEFARNLETAIRVQPPGRSSAALQSEEH